MLRNVPPPWPLVCILHEWVHTTSFSSQPQAQYLKRGLAHSKSSEMLEEITESKDQSRALIACFWSLLNLQVYNSAQYRVGTKHTVTDYPSREATGLMLPAQAVSRAGFLTSSIRCTQANNWACPAQRKWFCPFGTHVPIPIPCFLEETMEIKTKGRSY